MGNGALVGPDGVTPLNREQRRRLEKEGVQPDEFINIREYMDPKYKDKPVLRKEFMAILTHYHRQNTLRSRLRVALLGNRAVRWFLKTLFGMKVGPVTQIVEEK